MSSRTDSRFVEVIEAEAEMEENDSFLKLIRAAQRGDQSARNAVTEANMGLVVCFASSYQYLGVEFDDLIQEGCFALFDAIDHYDPERGAFSTCAMYWIRRTFNTATRLAELIPKPGNTYALRSKMEKGFVPKRFNRRRNSYESKASKKTTKLSEHIALGYSTDPEKVSRLDEPDLAPRKWSKPFTQHEVVPDVRVLSPDQQMMAKEQIAEMTEHLSKMFGLVQELKLGSCCVEVFLHRTGLDQAEETINLKAFGRKYGLTGERIRQHEAKMWDELAYCGSSFDRDTAKPYVEAISMLKEAITYE